MESKKKTLLNASFPPFLVSFPITIFLVVISRKKNVYVHTCKYIHFSVCVCVCHSTYSIKVSLWNIKNSSKYIYTHTYLNSLYSYPKGIFIHVHILHLAVYSHMWDIYRSSLIHTCLILLNTWKFSIVWYTIIYLISLIWWGLKFAAFFASINKAAVNLFQCILAELEGGMVDMSIW